MDKTYEELEPRLIEILQRGGAFWGKFTCGGCGSRQTFEEKNKLFEQGICEECGHTTDLDRWGLMVYFGPKGGV